MDENIALIHTLQSNMKFAFEINNAQRDMTFSPDSLFKHSLSC